MELKTKCNDCGCELEMHDRVPNTIHDCDGDLCKDCFESRQKRVLKCTSCGSNLKYDLYKGLCTKCNVKKEKGELKKIIVYYKFNSTTRETYYDNDEMPCEKTSGSNKVEIEHFEHQDINKAFDKEDGDGDDCGSWSRNIIMVTDEKNNLLWYPQSVWNKLKNRYQKAENKELSKMYDEMLERAKDMIKNGVF